MRRPRTVIGIDPGGNGTTGMVVCREWGKEANRWPRWLPGSVEVAWPVEGGPEKSDGGRAVFELDGLLERCGELPDIGVAIEDVAMWQTANEHLLSTCRQVGALEYVSGTVVDCGLVVLVLPVTYRCWLLGGRPKGNMDSLVDKALLAAYGGKERAEGGKRCNKCGGKGRRGRAVKSEQIVDVPGRRRYETAEGDQLVAHGGRVYRACPDCDGRGHAPRGPLYDLWNPSNQHCRAALAVAVYAYNEVWK